MAAPKFINARIVILTAGLVGTLAAGARSAEPDPALELGLLSYAAFDAEEVQIARQTAQELLASGGIQTEWRDCAGNDSCAESPTGRPFVRVQLLPLMKSSDRSTSGDAIRLPTGPMSALVYVPRNAEIAQTLRRSPAGRSNPALSTLATGHVVGVTIAHEVGHLLGLSHRSVGVMKARLSADDLVRSRSAALVFLPDERDRMRQAFQALTPGGAAPTAPQSSLPEADPASSSGLDPVVTRVREHGGAAGRAIVVVVGPEDLPRPVWQRVKHLVAFRLHRPAEDGTTITDAAIYLVRTSDLYERAATALREDPWAHDAVWCFLAAVVSHEAAHVSEGTERQALEAEIAQLRRCQAAGHLLPSDGMRAVSHVAKVEAKLRAIQRQSTVFSP